VKEYSYDKYHENSNQIVRLISKEKNISSIDYRVKDILVDNYPEIENGCFMLRLNRSFPIRVDGRGLYTNEAVISADNNFFNLFTIPVISGNPEKPFKDIRSAVLTESVGRKLFGQESPIGKEVVIQGEIVTISAVIEDFPENSSISAGIIVNGENDNFKWSFHCENGKDKSTYRYFFSIYLALNEGVNRAELNNKINGNTELLKPYGEEMEFLALEDMHLYDPTIDGYIEKGSHSLLQLMSVIGIIILVLAIINYVNLTVAQQNKRNRDTGLRKTVGADRSVILTHLLAESLIVTILASGMALILVWASSPLFGHIFGTTITPTILFTFPNILYIPSAIFLLGIISGIGPALFLSKVTPIKVINGSHSITGNKSYGRNALAVFQFATSIILICAVLVVKQQLSYVKHKDLGFNKEQLLKLDIPDIEKQDRNKAMLLVEELRKSPYIKSLSLSKGVPGNVQMQLGTNIEGSDKNIMIPSIIADSSFLKTMGLEIVKGRDLQPGDYGKVCFFNESAYKHFEFDNLTNKRFNNWHGHDIIGVVKDFHFNSLHKDIGPVCLIITPKNSPTAINIRFNSGGTPEGIKYLKDTWGDLLSEYPLKFEFYDQWFDTMYKKEERFAKSIGLFAMLAIVVSCIGMLGLSIFSSERRIKEIGVRKVNGAKISEIVGMLNGGFIKWVMIAFIIAIPVSYYIMGRWLESFAYRTELSWWIFALAGVMALGIALITVSWQSYKAATRNPVEALRYE
jgi:putative ABC transport system permease protein